MELTNSDSKLSNSLKEDKKDSPSLDSIFCKADLVENKSSTEEIGQIDPHHLKKDETRVVHPIHQFLRPHEIQKLGAPEARLLITSFAFHILENGMKGTESKGGGKATLYRALSQAITGEEEDEAVIRQVIAKTLISSWSIYGRILVPAYRYKIKGFTPEEIPKKSADVQRGYLRASLSQGIEGTIVEIIAAAKKYGFTYTIIFQENELVSVMNCQDEETKKNATRKYFFLRTGENFEDWHWYYLTPYGRNDPMKIKIPSGVYPINILTCYHFNTSVSSLKREFIPNTSEKYPNVFVLENGGLYGCVLTEHQDIFSTLSVLLYSSAVLSNEIFEALRGITKFPFSTIATLLRKRRRQRFSMTFEPGTLQDLRTAAKTFNFTYTLYAIDEGFNFLKLDEISSEFNKQNERMGDGDLDLQLNPEHLAFLIRTRKNCPLEWCALVQIKDAKLTPKDQTQNEFTGQDLSDDPEVLNTLYPRNPIRSPYTIKKKGPFGIRYRVLSKEARVDLKTEMGYEKRSVVDIFDNEKDAADKTKISEDTEEDYFGDFSDASTVNDAQNVKDKVSFTRLFWKGAVKALNLRKDRVAPSKVEPELTEMDVKITYYDEGEEK